MMPFILFLRVVGFERFGKSAGIGSVNYNCFTFKIPKTTGGGSALVIQVVNLVTYRA